MRSLLSATGLLLTMIAACESGPLPIHEPPVLEVSSPARSLIRGHAGPVVVSGTVTPNAHGDAVDQVRVNDVQATVGADGAFSATIDVRDGATLIETVARDTNGTIASDTRAVQAGQLRPVGSDVPNAIAVAMSADAFAKLSAAAGPILEGLDLGAMLAPLQPMVHVGSGCNYARLSVDNVKFSGAKIAMSPVQGGLAFRAELDRLDVPGRAAYGVLCADFSNTLRVTADRVVVAGTLTMTPSGMAGFTTRLVSPVVSLTNLQISASGIPGDILDLLALDAAIQLIVSRAAELAMNPLMNRALGALGGPQQLAMFGKQLTLQVAPSAIAFTPGGASLQLNLKVLLAGSEASPGFLFTDNGAPALDASHGFQLGIADDLANEMLAEAHQVGALELAVPIDTGLFDTTQIHMTLPPMISADARDGRLRLVLGDMFATFTARGTPVGKAAINARVDLEIAPVSNGYGVALQLGTPEIHVDALDDVVNTTGLPGDVLAHAVAVTLGAQLAAITKLLVAIPLPQISGIQLRNLAIGSDMGYVMISGQLD